MHRNMRFCAAVCPFLLLAALLLSLLCACGDSYPYMNTVAGETYRYRLSGNGYIQSVQVYDGERSRGTVRIRQSTRLEEPYENNGLVTGDFNGDGLEDFYVILSAREGVTDIACYLAKKNGGYTRDKKLSALHNLVADAENGTLLAYSEEEKEIARGKDGTPICNRLYTLTAYTYKDGVLSPLSAIRLTYYADEEYWSYTTLGYDADGIFTEMDEKWLTPENLPDYDFRPGGRKSPESAGE